MKTPKLTGKNLELCENSVSVTGTEKMRGGRIIGAVLLAAAASVSAAPPLSAEAAPPAAGEESPGAFSLLAQICRVSHPGRNPSAPPAHRLQQGAVPRKVWRPPDLHATDVTGQASAGERRCRRQGFSPRACRAVCGPKP